MPFSKKLSKLRNDKGLTQNQMAAMVGVGIAQIRRYEKGKSTPSLAAIKKIAVTFGVSADELVFGNGEGVAAQKLDPGLLKKFEEITKLPKKEIEAVEIMLDGIIVKNQLNDMVGNK